MTIERLGIGQAPCDEPCAQTGVTPNHFAAQTLECSVYRAALIGRFGPPPLATEYQIRTHAHDFGCYRELQIVFDPKDAGALSYAQTVVDGLQRWSDGGMIAPVRYDAECRAVVDVPSEGAAVTAAIVRLSRLIHDGYGKSRDAEIVANLCAYYDAAADQAAAMLWDMGIRAQIDLETGAVSWAG